MSVCKACGKDNVRKTRLGLVAGEVGWTMGRVCRECARRGLLVVGVVTTPAPIVREVKSDGIKQAVAQIHALRKGWEANLGRAADPLASEMRAERAPGAGLHVDHCADVSRIEGLDVALQVLDRLGGA